MFKAITEDSIDKSCGSSFWYLMSLKVERFFFDLLFSISQCLCMSLSKHDVRCQVYMKEAVPSKEAAEASDERRHERAVLLHWGVWLLWMSTTTMQSFQVCIKMMKLISNCSWLLRDSTSSDAKLSPEEALQMCSDVMLCFANSDTFGYFLDTFWILLESWANVGQFRWRAETLLCHFAQEVSPASDIWWVQCVQRFFFDYWALYHLA